MATNTPTSRILIALQDYLLDPNTVVTGTGWALASEENVQTNKFSSAATASGNSTAIGIDLATELAVEVLSVPKHTLGLSSTYRVRISNNQELLTNPAAVPLIEVLFDSGSTPITLPPVETDIPYTDYEEWANTFTNSSPPPIALPDINTRGRYVYLEFNDPDSTEYTIGKVTVGPAWRPTGGLSASWKQRHVTSKKQHKRLNGGSVFSEDRIKTKQLVFTLQTLKEVEAFNQVTQIDQFLGKLVPWLVLLDPGDTTNTYKMFMYGTNGKVSPLKNTFYGFYSKTYTVEEWV